MCIIYSVYYSLINYLLRKVAAVLAKTKKSKKQLKPVSIIAIILCSCIALYFIISFIKVNNEIKEKEAQLTELESILESQVAENKSLEEAVSKGDEDSLIEEYARKKGYVKSDERVYVDITPGQEE